jgi:hypothetical protein
MSTSYLYYTGTQSGKTVWGQMVESLMKPDVQTLSSARVDNKTWYTVKLSMPAREWLVQQPVEEWHEHLAYYFDRKCFDVSEQLYTALKLKWT